MFCQVRKTNCELLFILGTLLEGISTNRAIEHQAGRGLDRLLNLVRNSTELFLSSNNASLLCAVTHLERLGQFTGSTITALSTDHICLCFQHVLMAQSSYRK